MQVLTLRGNSGCRWAHGCTPRLLASQLSARLQGMVPAEETILTNLRRGALEFCVLAMLTDEELYGLDIARRLTVDGLLMSSEGTLYPLLTRLRTAGLVTTTWQQSVEGPPRRYYALTPDGRDSLAAFTRTWPAFRDAVDHALDRRDPP